MIVTKLSSSRLKKPIKAVGELGLLDPVGSIFFLEGLMKQTLKANYL